MAAYGQKAKEARVLTIYNAKGEHCHVPEDHPQFAEYRKKWPLDAPPETSKGEGAAKAPKKGD